MPPVIQYPLDLTGVSTNNLVVGEAHDLATASNRAFVPNHGPFYTRGLVVRMHSTGAILTPEVQYKAVQLFPEATLRTGLEVCSVIVIVDETIGTEFDIDYQVLGGDYSSSTVAIQQLIDSLMIDERNVLWGSIIGKPAYFPPAPHLHDIGDLYGFEYITAALEALRQAILTGDAASHTEIYQYIDHQDQEIRDSITAFDDRLTDHIANTNNPHATTKGQVGLGNVDNFATASDVQAVAGLANNLFMTPFTTAAAIAANGDLSAHIGNTNNPHSVTKAQVGLSNVQNYAIATQAEAEAGTINTAYMTPLRTAQALAPMVAHMADLDNPHEVTSVQVGLGNVDNYATGTILEAQTGTEQHSFMTPYLVRIAIEAFAGGKWIFTGDDVWGCAREERSGLTIQWGTSATLSVGQASFLFYRRKWSTVVAAGKPLALIPSVTSIPDSRDVGAWINRSPLYCNWLKSADVFALPSGVVLPSTADACMIALGRVSTSFTDTGKVFYIAVGHTDVDSIVTGAPSNGQGTAIAAYTPTGPVTVTLSPTSVTDNISVINEDNVVYSDLITPTMSGGNGTYSVLWTVQSDGGRPGDITIDLSGNRARLAFTANNLMTVGATDTVTVTLRCSVTSASVTDFEDVVVILNVARVADLSHEPNNLNFELGDVGWLGMPAITTTGAQGGSWKGRVVYDGGVYTTIEAIGARACTPGTTISVAGYVKNTGAASGVRGWARIVWFDSAGVETSIPVEGGIIDVVGGTTYRQSIATGVVPAGAAYYTVGAIADITNPSGIVDFDTFTLNYVEPLPGGGGGCVDVNMYMDSSRQANIIEIGDIVDGSTYEPDGVVDRTVRANRRMYQPCYRMVTESGIALIASESTPMTMKDNSSRMFPDMLNQLVLVDDDGDIRWEMVTDLYSVGVREVILFNVDDQSYFAGEAGNRRIATHNMPLQKN